MNAHHLTTDSFPSAYQQVTTPALARTIIDSFQCHLFEPDADICADMLSHPQTLHHLPMIICLEHCGSVSHKPVSPLLAIFILALDIQHVTARIAQFSLLPGCSCVQGEQLTLQVKVDF